MTLEQFRRIVVDRFGRDLAALTPESAIEFATRTRESVFPSPRVDGRYVIDAHTRADSYEHAVRGFLIDSLAQPPDIAAIGLWLCTLEHWASTAKGECDERFADLLRELEDELDDEDAPPSV
jgi:hypothetical protein